MQITIHHNGSSVEAGAVDLSEWRRQWPCSVDGDLVDMSGEVDPEHDPDMPDLLADELDAFIQWAVARRAAPQYRLEVSR